MLTPRKYISYILFFLPAFILFIIPFFWFSPGEMDLGGDANRLYFYDPISYIKSTALYAAGNEGRGLVDPKYYYLPYVALIAVGKYLFGSSTVVIDLFNGLKLGGSYLGISLIVLELLQRKKEKANEEIAHIASVLAGLFYVVSLGSMHLSFFWDRALFTHDQVFLNPLLFYLILKFIVTDNSLFLYISLVVSFVFSTNFGLAATPALAAFYPVSILFLLFYRLIILKKSIPWWPLCTSVLLFFGIHAFHLLGSIASVFDKRSVANMIIFDKREILESGINYFMAVLRHGQAIVSLFVPSESPHLRWTSFIGPCVIFFGLFLHKRKRGDFLLILSFFLLIFFFVTVNITGVGVSFYKNLFYIPGFSMFRLFFEKWMYVFVFFYSLSFGYALFILLSRLRIRYRKALSIVLLILFIISGWPLFLGSLVHQSIRGSNNIQGVITMDPRYEQTLQKIRLLPEDGKILVLPLTDYFRQVFSGKDGGAYEGPSSIYHLTHKYSFVGYQSFGYKQSDPSPYAEDIMRFSREKKYGHLMTIFQVLNIRYIFWNSDPNAYEANFIPGSFGYMMTSLPKTQREYASYISHLSYTKIYENGPYMLYEIKPEYYNSTIYIPDTIITTDDSLLGKDRKGVVFIDPSVCSGVLLGAVCNQYDPTSTLVSFVQDTPSQYTLTLKNYDSTKDMLLVMQHMYHDGWKIFHNDKPLNQGVHIVANKYANGWIIPKNTIKESDDIIFIIRLDHQKYFTYGWGISGVFLVLLIIVLIHALFNYAQHS